jgi:exosome complex exonuclease RRP6
MDNDQDATEDSAELLNQLLAALATGARAVQGLPLEDDFEYQSSFPEFSHLVGEARESLLDTLLLAIDDFSNDDAMVFENNLEDPLLWETCADACDALLEQVEAHLRSDVNLSDLSDVARQRAQSSFGRLLEGIVDMEKPQNVFSISIDNNRRVPFVPPISEKPHAIVPLDLSLRPGHGLQSRFGELRTVSVPDGVVASTQHVPHVYETEIRSFSYQNWQLEGPSSKPTKIPVEHNLQATWIDTPNALQDLVSQIETNGIREIALDLEAHSYHSFAGLVCLMQLSFRNSQTQQIQNYLIDPFPLWNQLSILLGPILANPEIVKILHGADSDIQWLQRDFGLYIVNLFDTGRAARALSFSSAGYAYLLKHYVGVDADKSHQLSDWRQRPLPSDMRLYAIMDTHYLLDIYHHLQYDLTRHADTSIQDVLDTSRKISLIRYAPDAFKPDGYKSLMRRRNAKTELNNVQESVLEQLHDWRDQTARKCDESAHYVCSNQALLRLALSCPTNLKTLQGLFNPMPPLLLRFAKEVLGVIHRAQDTEDDKPSTVSTPSVKTTPVKTSVGAPSSAFFKPAMASEDEPRDRLLSPVLGTEALYMQAGWITPQHGRGPDFRQVDPVATTTDEDDDVDMSGGGKPRHGLNVHEANQNYRTSQFTPHSLQLGGDDDEDDDDDDEKEEEHVRGRKVDGMGAARAAREHSQSPVEHPSIEDDAELAQQNAAHIRTAMAQDGQMMGLISPTTGLDDDAGDDGGDEQEDEQEKSNELGEEEFVIPRSMREIYRISNRNRRNKKAGSPLPDQALAPSNEKEFDALAKADEVLKARGLDGKSYFDEIPGSPKRPRTASYSSEEQGHDSGNISREDDIALMQEIGWIKNKEEVDSMLKQRRAADGEEGGDPVEDDSEEEEAHGPMGKATKPTFDYSTIGPIGAFNPEIPPPANPFFAGAATTGGHLNQQFGKSEKKKQNPTGGNKGKPRRQVERPEKRADGRAQAFKKR